MIERENIPIYKNQSRAPFRWENCGWTPVRLRAECWTPMPFLFFSSLFWLLHVLLCSVSLIRILCACAPIAHSNKFAYIFVHYFRLIFSFALEHLIHICFCFASVFVLFCFPTALLFVVFPVSLHPAEVCRCKTQWEEKRREETCIASI